MNFEEILEFRYACKRFKKDENIPTSDIDKIINAANLTPTSCNMQHAHLLIVETPDNLKKLNEICYNQGTTRTANKIIVVLAGKNSYMGHNTDRYYEVITGLTNRLNSFLPGDKQITNEVVAERTGVFCKKNDTDFMAWSKANSYLVAMNIMNQAADLKINSCPIEGFNQEVFNNYFPKYKEEFEIAMVVSLGYKDEVQPQRSRLPIELLYEKI